LILCHKTRLLLVLATKGNLWFLNLFFCWEQKDKIQEKFNIRHLALCSIFIQPRQRMKIFRWNVWGIFQANERTASRKTTTQAW
jgi:hypothetical protein